MLEPLRLVVHHRDGSWDFLCNTTIDPKYLVTVHTEDDSSAIAYQLSAVRNFPGGHRAEREDVGKAWRRELDLDID